MIILVLGMHRSGTSAVAGLLHFGGVFMGERLLGRDRRSVHNKKGHWEDLELININDKILNFFGGSWSRVPELDFDKLPSELKKQMSNLVYRYNVNHRVWGWKDPRMSVVFSMWYEIIKLEKLKVLYVNRDRRAVVKSLLKRNRSMSGEEAGRLWEFYNEMILLNIEKYNLRSLFLNYEELIINPRAEQKRIEQFLRIDLGLGYKFIDRELQHWK